jgi:hypothetical protein
MEWQTGPYPSGLELVIELKGASCESSATPSRSAGYWEPLPFPCSSLDVTSIRQRIGAIDKKLYCGLQQTHAGRGPLVTAPDHRTPVPAQVSTEPRSEVRPTVYLRSSIQVLTILPAELVDDALEVVFSGMGIIALYGRLVMFVDQILVILGRMLDLRFGTTTFNAVIQACEIRL